MSAPTGAHGGGARGDDMLPVIPYEHGGGETGFDASIEVGWPARRVGICVEGEEEGAALLREAGWTVLEAATLDAEALIAALGVGGG